MKELENITTLVLKQDGTIHIDNMEKYLKSCDIVEKELKALEIIKKKCVDLEYLKCCENYEQYKTLCSYWNEITEQEFDLLREVLL